MAVVNRYSRPIQYSTYNPRSLQELMIAPSYMRQQHDALDLGRMELDSKLAQVSGLDVHNERLKEQQDLLNQQSQAIAEQLQKEGFNSSNKSAFMRFNKAYQDAIGPNGDIGKILAAKEAYAKNYQEFIDKAPKEWGQEDLLRNWNKLKDAYTGFDEEGNIVNIGQLGAPNRVRYEDKLKAAKDLLGEEVVKHLISGRYHFEPQPDGSLGVVNKSGTLIETSNANNIAAAREMLYGELNDPNSEWRRSIAFEGTDPNQVLSQVNLGLRSMFKNNVKDNRSQSYSQIRSADDSPNPMDLVVASETFLSTNASKLSYDDIQSELFELNRKSDLKGEELKKKEELTYLKLQLDEKLNDDSEYERLMKERTRVLNEMKQKPLFEERSGINSQLERIEKEISELADTYKNDIIRQSTDYSLIPNTPQQRQRLQLTGEAIGHILGNYDSENLRKMVTVENIYGNGKQAGDNMTDDNITQLSELLSNSRPEDFYPTSFTAKGMRTGKPEYTVTIRPSYLDGDDKGKAVTVRFSFNEIQNEAGVQTINKYLQGVVSEQGPQGYQLAQSMELNRRKSLYNGEEWGNIIPEIPDFEQMDPVLVIDIRNKLAKKIKRDDPEKDLSTISLEELEQYYREFYDENKYKTIYLK